MKPQEYLYHLLTLKIYINFANERMFLVGATLLTRYLKEKLKIAQEEIPMCLCLTLTQMEPHILQLVKERVAMEFRIGRLRLFQKVPMCLGRGKTGGKYDIPLNR